MHKGWALEGIRYKLSQFIGQSWTHNYSELSMVVFQLGHDTKAAMELLANYVASYIALEDPGRIVGQERNPMLVTDLSLTDQNKPIAVLRHINYNRNNYLELSFGHEEIHVQNAIDSLVEYIKT